MQTENRFKKALFLVVAITVSLIRGGVIGEAQAGGPLLVDPAGSGIPYTWQIPIGGAASAFFNVETGRLSEATDNTTGVLLVRQAFAALESIPTSTITYTEGPTLVDPTSRQPIDVDPSNVLSVLFRLDGQSPIIFDENGMLFSLLGLPPGALGVAGPEITTVAAPFAIVEGFALFNGAALAPLGGFSPAQFSGVMVHEFGHFSNLAHSNVNGQAFFFGDQSGPTPTNSFGRPPASALETMYPFLIPGTGLHQATPHADDIGILSALYPTAEFSANQAAISGRILLSEGGPGLLGVNVIGRNPANPFADAVSGLSGDFVRLPGSDAAGNYILHGLTNGASYVVFTDEIVAGGFSTPPLQPLPGPEEFYNGLNESSNPLMDDPSDSTEVAVNSVATGIDIIFNGLPPDPNEPNNSFSEATPIPCPFESQSTSIDPFGDIDFYTFQAPAGTILLADIDAQEQGSELDSLVGVFDGAQQLLAFSDDAPAPDEDFSRDSFLSTLLTRDDDFVLAVTSFLDFDFNGGFDGITRGVYDLSVECRSAIVINDLISATAPQTTETSITGNQGERINLMVITVGFTNTSSTPIQFPFFKVRQLTGRNLLFNAEGGPAADDAILLPSVGTDNILAPEESFTQDFVIQVQQTRFMFWIDLMGLPGGL